MAVLIIVRRRYILILTDGTDGFGENVLRECLPESG